MNFGLHDRLFSYQPFWNDWNLNQDIFLDRFPNVYKVVNQTNGKVAILKVFTINVETFANTLKCSYDEVKENLVKVINSIVNVNILKDCNNVVKYDDVLIKEILQEGQIIGYDIIFRIDNVDCLITKVKEDTKFTQNDVLKMLYDISSVLSIAHIKGLIHKYINLQTIFIDSNKSYKLGDFGIYSLLSTSRDITYLAPEVLNSKRSNIQSDIYSLGLVAYQLLNNNNFTKASSNGTLPVIKGVNSTLMRVIQKMCATEPTNRYNSVSSLITDLNSVDIPIEPKTKLNKEVIDTKVFPTHDVPKEKKVEKSQDVQLEETEPIKSNEEKSKNKVVQEVQTEVLSEDTKQDFNVVPSIIACIVIGFIVCIFGAMLYKTLTDTNNDEPLNDVVQNHIETTTSTITTTPVTTTECYTTFSPVVLTVTEESTIPTTITTTKTTTTTEPTIITTTKATTTTVPTTTTTIKTTTTTFVTTTKSTTTTSQSATTTSVSDTTTSNTTTSTTTKSENVKHNYYFKKGSYTWEEAYSDATSNGYQLATFTNSDELNAIRSIARSSGLKYLWLGGKVKIYTDDTNTSYAYCYWQNGDDDTFLNSKDANWYYSEKYKVQEPSGWDVNTNELEPYIMIWYLDDWTLCDNSASACSNGEISGYIYMD